MQAPSLTQPNTEEDQQYANGVSSTCIHYLCSALEIAPPLATLDSHLAALRTASHLFRKRHEILLQAHETMTELCSNMLLKVAGLQIELGNLKGEPYTTPLQPTPPLTPPLIPFSTAIEGMNGGEEAALPEMGCQGVAGVLMAVLHSLCKLPEGQPTDLPLRALAERCHELTCWMLDSACATAAENKVLMVQAKTGFVAWSAALKELHELKAELTSEYWGHAATQE